MEEQDIRQRAEQLNLQAELRCIKIQSHIKVYGRRNAAIEQEARNGIEFIEAALKLFPESPRYLNTYALLLADGLGKKKLGLEILEKAAQLAPEDIQRKQNIRSLKTPSQGCLVLCFSGIVSLAVGYVLTRIRVG
jgi:tetratricopeptide (TPR) repeat protein